MSDMSISPILLSAKEAKRPYALARSSLDTAMQVRALGWGFRKTAAQLYCPNTLESCMLGYLGKLFKNPCSQAKLNKIVPFGFSLQRQKMVFFCHQNSIILLY